MASELGGGPKGQQHTGRNTLDTTTTGETADSGLGDTLNVVLQDLAMTLGTTLAEALATLSAWSNRSATMRLHTEKNASWAACRGARRDSIVK